MNPALETLGSLRVSLRDQRFVARRFREPPASRTGPWGFRSVAPTRREKSPSLLPGPARRRNSRFFSAVSAFPPIRNPQPTIRNILTYAVWLFMPLLTQPLARMSRIVVVMAMQP